MREILFRGKRKDNGEWVYGNLIRRDNSGEWSYFIGQNSLEYEVIPSTVGQYTGLTDKNGKKIFEGDVIRYADIDEYQYYLECQKCPEDYDEELFKNMWAIDEIVYGDKIGYPAFDLNSHNFESNGLSELQESGQYFYQIIGNIHDNPELLETK